MRILHTSDWHLGQNFFTKSRRHEHQAFLRWLLELVEQESVDAVLVAGDVFDTGTPPSYAREMYNQFVVDLNALGATLVILGGNHDSVSTLNESKQLLSCLNTHVVANSSDDLEQQLFVLNDRQGEPGALLCAVPFIRARDVLQSVAGDSGSAKQKQLGEAIKAHYANLYARAEDYRAEQDLKLPIVATGHLTALGVSKADSERDIYIGTLEGFDAAGFPPADYIALGHIHRPQLVAKSEHIRYSGSPIPLSFDELKSDKQVLLVEFDREKRTDIRPVPVPMFQQMALVKGSLSEIEQQLAQYSSSEEPVWLSVLVQEQDFLSDLQQRVQVLTEGLPVEVVQLQRDKPTRNQALVQQQQETLAELTPFDVFERRLSQEQFSGEDEQARLKRLHTTFAGIVESIELQGDDV
jgi:exonuclease SbcD